MKQLPLQLICTLVIILSFPSLTAAQTVPLSSTTAAAGQNSNFPAATLSLPRLQRCAGIKGPACSAYYLQTLEDLQLARPIPQQKPCPINQHTGTPCGLGVCHADTGLCDCPAGVLSLKTSSREDSIQQQQQQQLLSARAPRLANSLADDTHQPVFVV